MSTNQTLLHTHVQTFQTSLRALTRMHGTDRAMRIIGFKVPPFVEEMKSLGLDVTVDTKIGREGVIVTATLKE